jgi:hypothetical protein
MHNFQINALIQMQIEVHYEYNQQFSDKILLRYAYKQELNYMELK